MALAQLERWRLDSRCPQTGKIFEVPMSWMVPRLGLSIAFAGVLWYSNYLVYGHYKEKSFSPEFVAEAKKIGKVAQRFNGPPVYLNPFTHKIPGNISGPEDIKKQFEDE